MRNKCPTCLEEIRDVVGHLEEFHTGPPPTDEVKLKCSDCGFKNMLVHCSKTNHSSRPSIDWRNFKQLEEERIYELIRLGCKILGGINEHSATTTLDSEIFKSARELDMKDDDKKQKIKETENKQLFDLFHNPIFKLPVKESGKRKMPEEQILENSVFNVNVLKKGRESPLENPEEEIFEKKAVEEEEIEEEDDEDISINDKDDQNISSKAVEEEKIGHNDEDINDNNVSLDDDSEPEIGLNEKFSLKEPLEKEKIKSTDPLSFFDSENNRTQSFSEDELFSDKQSDDSFLLKLRTKKESNSDNLKAKTSKKKNIKTSHCRVCKIQIPKSAPCELVQHVLGHNKTLGFKLFFCSYCDYSTQKKNNAHSHCKTVHGDRNGYSQMSITKNIKLKITKELARSFPERDWSKILARRIPGLT